MKSLGRYAMASVGPVGAAAAQFLLSLILLQRLSPAAFGSFSFLLIAVQLLIGIWSALFNAPLLVLTVRDTDAGGNPAIRAIFTTNLLGAVLAGIVLSLIALAMGLAPSGASIMGAYAMVALLRSLGRAHAFAIERPWRAMRSDIAYSVTLLLATALWSQSATFTLAGLALLIAAAVGLLPLGRTYAEAQFGRIAPQDLAAYLPVWREHSGWSLTGVITTEATANAHSYLVTWLVGPAAFAPIAATALLIRPIMVATNALMEYERAQMARMVVAKDRDRAQSSMRLLRAILLLICLATATIAAALLLWAPTLVYPSQYSMDLLVVGTTCWIAVATVRAVRVPDSALLQAAGQFRRLAYASMFASIISIMLVVACLSSAQPIWSIAAMGIGELAMTIWLWVAARRMLNAKSGWEMAAVEASQLMSGKAIRA